MNSVGTWPKLFNGNTTIISTDNDKNNQATLQCVHLLLASEADTLFGDPDFGLRLKRYAFDQNNYILRDILIDEIYTQITTFCPQLFLERKNVKITQEGKKLYAKITCKNQKTFENNVLNLVLLETEENE